MNRPSQWIPFIGSLVLAVTLGYFIGRLTTLSQTFGTPMRTVTDTRPTVPVIVLDGTVDGSLQGTLTGNVRLFAGDTQILPGADGAFSVPQSIFKAQVNVVVPAGMHFVASKKGKKYYSVTSASGERIAPENRVYFETAEEAEAAGFTP